MPSDIDRFDGWSSDYAPENFDDAYAPECQHLSIDDPLTEAQLLSGVRPREWTVRCEDCGATWNRKRNDHAE